MKKEYRLFQRLFSMLNANSPNPELLIYLHRTPKKFLRRFFLHGHDERQDFFVGMLVDYDRFEDLILTREMVIDSS